MLLLHLLINFLHHRSLGLKPEFKLGEYPLHSLARSLKSAQKDIPHTEGGVSVVPGLFEAYRSSLVAPDHLRFGLAQDVLRAMLVQCTPQARKYAGPLILGALRSSRLGRQREIFNVSAACLHQMGMSDVFAVLLVAPVCFENAIYLDSCVSQPGFVTMTIRSWRGST